MDRDIPVAAARFAISGTPAAVEPLRGGHIHDSYRLTCLDADQATFYLLQRINSAVFGEPALMAENIQRVTTHIARRLRLQETSDVDRRVLELVPTRQGDFCLRDEAGAFWRMYRFIESVVTHETVPSPRHAEEAGRAFGLFQSLLSDWTGPRLHETIPDFHNTPLRFEALEKAVANDVCGRVSTARAEIDSAMRHRPLGSILVDLHRRREIPERIVHNDAKISNVLFDAGTGEAMCVVDLDTVMPGLSLYDFGDMVRSMTCPAAEDETDLARVEAHLPLFEGLARGYLTAAGSFLNTVERQHLVLAGKIITLEQGVRFLTDFLNGDRYYKTSRPLHNLDRCRTQLRLLDSMICCEQRMQRIVDTV
jgi:hypothetical protein